MRVSTTAGDELLKLIQVVSGRTYYGTGQLLWQCWSVTVWSELDDLMYGMLTELR